MANLGNLFMCICIIKDIAKSSQGIEFVAISFLQATCLKLSLNSQRLIIKFSFYPAPPLELVSNVLL